MLKFTLDSLSKLGKDDPTYGQKYWGTAVEVDVPVSFNSKFDIELTEDSGPISIVAEESSNKESKKGTAYLQLKKVRVAEPSQDGSQSSNTGHSTPEQPVQSPSVAHSEDYSGLLTILKRIEAKVDKLIGEDDEEEDEPEEKTRDWANLGKDKVYDLDGEPLPEPPEDL